MVAGRGSDVSGYYTHLLPSPLCTVRLNPFRADLDHRRAVQRQTSSAHDRLLILRPKASSELMILKVANKAIPVSDYSSMSSFTIYSVLEVN